VTQFKDSRVAAAFNKDQLQYQYMVGSEQRLTGLENQVSALSGIGSPAAILSAIAALQASDTSQNANIATLFANDTTLSNNIISTNAAVVANTTAIGVNSSAIATLQANVVYRNFDYHVVPGLSQSITSTGYIQIFNTLSVFSNARPVFMFLFIGNSYLTGGATYIQFGLRLDNNAIVNVAQLWGTTDTAVAAAHIFTPSSGSRLFSAWASVPGGGTGNIAIHGAIFAIEL
jgi:hypothetical protein